MSRNRGSSFGMTLRRASSADSFSASPRAAQPDCTPSHSVMAQLACLGIKEAQPIKTCRSRSSPASRSPPVIGAQLPRNDICGNEAAPINAGDRLLRPTPSRLRSPSPGAPAAATTVATVAPGGHSPGDGPIFTSRGVQRLRLSAGRGQGRLHPRLGARLIFLWLWLQRWIRDRVGWGANDQC